MRVLLIVPAYNEEANIERVVQTIVDYAAQETAYQLDYIIINDGSTDNTAAICRGAGISHHSSRPEPGDRRRGANQGISWQTGRDMMRLCSLTETGSMISTPFPRCWSRLCGTNVILSLAPAFWARGVPFHADAPCRHSISDGDDSALLRLPVDGSNLRLPGGQPASHCFLSNRYPVDYPEPESIISLSKCMFRIQEAPVNMFERSGGTSSISPWKSVYYMFKVSLAILCTGFQRKRRVS